MMKRTWLVAAVACVVVLLVGMVSCSSAVQKEQVHLVIKVPALAMNAPDEPNIESADRFLEMAAADFAAQYEDAEVTFDVITFEQTAYDEAIVDCFDTEDAVDVLYAGYFNMGSYVHTGRVVPIDDVVSEEIRADVSDGIWSMSQANGKTYMMPFLSLQNVLCYNKDLFRQAGLEAYIAEGDVIQSWTLEEWEEILDTLAAELPAGSFPMMMYANNDQGDTHVMTLLRSQGSEFFDEEGRFDLSSDEGVAALQWIKDGYDAGWFPTRCEGMEMSDCGELFYQDQLAIYLVNSASMEVLDGMDVGLVNLPSADGTGYATSFVNGFQVYDNGDAAKIQVAKDFVQYVCETDRWRACSTGGISAFDSVAAQYADRVPMTAVFSENSVNVVDFTENNPNWRGVRDVFYLHIQDLLRGDATPAQVAAAIDADCNVAIEEGYQTSVLHE